MKVSKKKKAPGTIIGRLRAADPFELIRWLARSQHDPRKALAELVQNSLDAGASRITVTRLRKRGVSSIHVLDDGEGVIPEQQRPEALTYIATHIGHSRKRNLTPQQRRELMLQGKYGIGLLGFWCIGRELEMRTQVADSKAWALTMREDSPTYRVHPCRGRLPLGGTWTEVVVHALHRPALASLSGRRIADYLAAELRGQLLSRQVLLTIHDRIARGRSPKLLPVVPVKFTGRRLPLDEQIETDGFGAVRVELYLLPKRVQEQGQVTVSVAGTTVYNNITDFEIEDFRHPPWSEGRLNGLIDFPALTVTPGTRRGVVPDQAALAFVGAVKSLEPQILEEMAVEERREAESLGKDMLRQLQRAFRELQRRAPEYDLFAVRSGQSREGGEGAAKALPGLSTGGDALALGEISKIAETEVTEDALPEIEQPPGLLPASPLARVKIVPARSRVERGGARRLHALAEDEYGQAIAPQGVAYTWECTDGPGQMEKADGPLAILRAGDQLAPCTVTVEAVERERRARAQAIVEVVAELPVRLSADGGIPQPSFVNDPDGAWRSRLVDSRWEVNSAHRDYLTALESPKRKLRYLASLLAKEIVAHSFPSPQAGSILERMVEVLAITDQRLDR